MASVKIRWMIACLALACAACGRSASAKSELHYGLTLVPTGIDPHINASSELGIPLASVYDTLVFRNPAGGFVPGLAQRWEITPDGRQYTFYLRHDVHFQDGTPFNAQAVKINLERVSDPANHSQKARYLIDAVQSVLAVDEFTVRLELSAPFAPLLDSLSQVYLGMASPAALEKWGKDYPFHQVGTGPFRFIDYIPGDHLTLERNPDYAWAPSMYRNKTAQVQRIVFRFYADPATRAPALLSGEADVMGEVLPRDADNLEKDGRFAVYPVNIPGQPLQFFFNTKLAPTDDSLVREALLAATDRETLVRTVFGSHSPVATGPLTASTVGAAAVVPADAFDLTKAEELLRQAGWVDINRDGIREKDGKPLHLKVVYPSWGLTPQVADLLELQWKGIGAEVELIQVASFSGLVEAQAGGAYHLISWNQAGTDPDLLRSFYRSKAAYNWTGSSDARLDALLDHAAGAGSDQERLDDYHALQQMIAAQYLILPIRDYVNLNVALRGVKGLHFTAQGWFPALIDVSLA